MSATVAWVSVVFMEGDEAHEVMKMLYDIDGVLWSGPYEESVVATVKHLKQWDQGEESEHSPYAEPPWADQDCTEEVGDYTLAWEPNGLYVSLNRLVRPDPTASHAGEPPLIPDDAGEAPTVEDNDVPEHVNVNALVEDRWGGKTEVYAGSMPAWAWAEDTRAWKKMKRDVILADMTYDPKGWKVRFVVLPDPDPATLDQGV